MRSLLWAGMFSTLTEFVGRVSVFPLAFELNSVPASAAKDAPEVPFPCKELRGVLRPNLYFTPWIDCIYVLLQCGYLCEGWKSGFRMNYRGTAQVEPEMEQ